MKKDTYIKLLTWAIVLGFTYLIWSTIFKIIF